MCYGSPEIRQTKLSCLLIDIIFLNQYDGDILKTLSKQNCLFFIILSPGLVRIM